MKSLARILTTTTATLAVFSILIFPDARADKKKKEAKHEHKHDHDHASVAGPNGGRIIHEVEP
ncbi:MAG: hypothetical protein GWO24_11660, partial [Akkermansiaceae bacterium]|nr:hypothetical protein [Akkermansiaceae bacterium]